MNKDDVCRELYRVADFHLFGAGSWPADREASAAFWKLLDDLELTTVPDKPGTSQLTPLGLELNVELISIFAGAVNLWDIPLVLDLMGYLNDKEAAAIYAAESQHPEHVIRQHGRRVYLIFRNSLNVRIDSRLQWPFYDDALGSGSRKRPNCGHVGMSQRCHERKWLFIDRQFACV